MRLAKLDLLAYGHFRGLSLDFSAPGIHVVLGRNEAGKSTTLRAIRGLFYGIDRSTPDAHVHKPADLRVGGTLERANGERVAFVRRKGNSNTLFDANGAVVDEGVLRTLLGGISQETFVHAYGLDHDTLAAGADALLQGRGDLGESLFDASVGGGGEVQRLLADLTREADALYKPRASALPLNDALKAFAEATKVIKEKQSLPEAFLQQEAGLVAASSDRAAKVLSKKEKELARTRLAHARRRAPLERRRERALEQRAALGALGEHVMRIASLKERFGAYEKSVEMRRTLVSELERLGDRVLEASRRAGIAADAGMESLRLDARKGARVQALLDRRTALSAAVGSANVEIAQTERALARQVEPGASEARPALPVAATEALAVAIERARVLGDIDARLANERARNERQRAALGAKAKALADLPLDALVALRLPAVASVEALDARATEVAKTIARLDERIADLEREASSIEKQTAGLAGDFAPPDVSVLASARGARDEAWKAARAASGAARAAAEIEMERLLREADVVADRMIREADRVTTLARLRSEAETNARQLDKARAERTTATTARAGLDDELAALFAGSGTDPRGFAETCQWLERHLLVVEAHTALVAAESDLLAEGRAASEARSSLTLALAATRRDAAPTQDEDVALRLVDLVGTAGRALAEIEEARREAVAAARAAVELRAKLDDRLALRARDEEQLAEVTTQLAELLGPLGVAADASAQEVNQSIESLRELFAVVDKRSDVDARARLADADVGAFETELRACLAAAAPDVSQDDPRAAAVVLFERGRLAHDSAQELTAIEAQLTELGDDDAIDDAMRALVADAAAAERAELELAEDIGELDAQIERLTRDIGAYGKGLEQMRAESNAAEAAATAQHHLARVRDGAERWCRVKLASVLLAREIERYREENQAPLLASTSTLFARLTLGAFSGIRAGFDDKDRPCLRCVRTDGAEVDVGGLSDGTRDQLYLSLRLASLLRRAEVSEPLPLILDDVLIQLDDQRAAAALTVLADVSRRMQVLFFTHHARLVELARDAVPAAALVVHELANPAPMLVPALDQRQPM